MGDRKVIGQVLLPNNTPYANLTILFRLRYGEYGIQGLVPRGDRTVKTDANGHFEITLWCNEVGLKPPTYSVAIGNRMFDFELLPGATPFNLFEPKPQYFDFAILAAPEERQMLYAIAGQSIF